MKHCGLETAHRDDVLVSRWPRGDGLLSGLTLALGGTTRQEMATFAIAVLQLPRGGDFEPLLETAIGLVLVCHVPFQLCAPKLPVEG